MRIRTRVVVLAVVLVLPLGAGAASVVLAPDDVPPAVPTEVRPAQPASDDGGDN